MDEKLKDVLDQYSLTVHQVTRGRGAFICETDQGKKQLKEYIYSEQRQAFEYDVKSQLRDKGYYEVDQFVPNKEGTFLSKGKDGRIYVLKDWFDGHECDSKNSREISMAVRHLGRLHKLMQHMTDHSGKFKAFYFGGVEEEFKRHTKELLAIKNYIKNKKQKNDFDQYFIEAYAEMVKDANASLDILNTGDCRDLQKKALELQTLCHGDYQHHHVLIQSQKVITVNFDKMNMNVQMNDLYLFMRKVLEKNQWNEKLGLLMLEDYQKVRAVTKNELLYLYALFLYPEKFWKISNHYFNTRKSWISEHNFSKLKRVIQLTPAKNTFLTVFCRKITEFDQEWWQ